VKARVVKPAKLGIRERNKLRKRQRIQTAVREMFSTRGYDEATLRGIAKRAHVALGTLFNYADDKRDLVFLIVNEELEEVTAQALNAATQRRSLLGQLMAIFECHYGYFAVNPVLSRIVLRELVFYSSGKQAEKFHEIRRRLMDGIERLVEDAQLAHSIQSREDAGLIARNVFFTFSAAVRWWIATPRPNPRTGLKDLRKLIKLQICGLRPKGRN
jgi:AcrR family transcriptional regulator